MKSNWKQRHREAEENRVGMEKDKLVELGIRFVCLALHNEFGFGAQRILRLREVINKYIENEIKSGTAAHTDARRHNVMYGLEKVNSAYEAIFEKMKSAQSAGTLKGADEKTS